AMKTADAAPWTSPDRHAELPLRQPEGKKSKPGRRSPSPKAGPDAAVYLIRKEQQREPIIGRTARCALCGNAHSGEFILRADRRGFCGSTAPQSGPSKPLNPRATGSA